MNQFIKSTCCLIFWFMVVASSWAGDNCWTPEKPYGGYIIDIVIDPQDPNILYVYCNNSGIFKSTDRGKNWRNISKNIYVKPTWYGDLEIDPVNSNIVYFTDDKNVYKSTDAGESWYPANNGVTNTRIIDIAINPFNHQELSLVGLGFYQSFDFGNRWDYKGFFHVTSYVVKYDHTVENLIYIGALNHTTLNNKKGFLKSEDNGLFWTEHNSGLQDFYIFSDIEIDPSDNQRIYITGESTYNRRHDEFPQAAPYHCIYKSEDQGSSWTCINNGLEINEARSITVHPNNSNILYLCTPFDGVLKSVNSGQSWEQTNNNLGSISAYSLTIDKINDIIYLGTAGSGLFKSSNHGESWEDCNQGLYGHSITAIEFNPQNSRTIYLGKYGQPFKSLDGGISWERLGTDSLAGVSSYHIKVDPIDTSIVYLSGLGLSNTSTNRGFFISFDSGNSWHKRNSGLPEDADAIAVDLFASDDRRILFLGTSQGVYVSRDLGQNWQAAKHGISDPWMYVQSIAVSKEDSNTVYASFPTALYKTIDGGRYWYEISQQMPGLGRYCFMDPNNSRRIVLTCGSSSPDFNDGAAYFSENGGASWYKFYSGEFASFAFDPNNSDRLLMGGFAVVKFSENGFWDYFEDISQGFDRADKRTGIDCLAFHPDSANKFYCGTNFMGLYSYRKTSSSVLAESRRANEFASFKLHQTYPNPFNPETTICFDVPEKARVKIEIFNLMGQHIRTFFDGERNAGSYQLRWNGLDKAAQPVGSGVYLCKMSARDFSATRKMVLVR
ncbi:MAG: T9SS type A sorting domain-containing protein [bacterium]|nr:T9SS type A sorting domain-containing protein [bacterium]